MRWLTADQHFMHRNIMEFAKRPFASIEDHDEALIDAWNANVRERDEVWVVGDVFFSNDAWEVRRMMRRLRGEKHLVLGNHDGTRARQVGFGVWDSVQVTAQVDGVTLCHDALGWAIKNGWQEGWPRMFCGHVHQNWRVTWGRFVNVGVDQWDYAPVAWEVASELFKD